MKTYRTYFCLWFVAFLLMTAALVFGPDKGSMHVWLNTYHSPFSDTFFRYYSQLAEWPLYLVMACFLFYRYSWTLYFAASELLSAGVTQLIKTFVNMPRPSAFFGNDPAFQQIVVDGVHLHHWHSFPSGHTATFFVFFTTLTLLLSSRKTKPSYAKGLLGLLFLLLALLGGYSRIYLSQHFLLDVTAGMLIGTLSPCLLWQLFRKLEPRLGDRHLRRP